MDYEKERAFLEANPPQRVVVERSWRERLLSRPWKPWVATRITWHDSYARRRLAYLWREAFRLPEGFWRTTTPEYALLTDFYGPFKDF